MKEMTAIIPGLQGEVPANSRKGFPYVGGKYELNDIKSFLISGMHFSISTYNIIQKTCRDVDA